MTTTEAYTFALSKIDKLKKETGIEVKIKASNCKDNPRVVEKYNLPERIPPELWCHISFIARETTNQRIKLIELRNYLGMCGISFDTSAGCGEIDWEFDWSFRYIRDEEQTEWRDACAFVDEMSIRLFNNEEI